MMGLGILSKITRNGYANSVSPRSAFLSSLLLLKDTSNQRSIISEYSTISPCHSQKICSPSPYGVVSGAMMVKKGFIPFPFPFPNPNGVVVSRRFISNAVWNPSNIISLGIVGCWVAIPLYYLNSKTVPFGKRGHFALASLSLEKKFGESGLERDKSDPVMYKGKILKSHHPQSIRVKKMWQKIIGGLRRNTMFQPFELFNWEIIVVDKPTTVNAASIAGGKIIVYTGLLNHLKRDDEIAHVIGHEVAHVVARHYAERCSVKLWLTILMGLLCKTTSDLLPPHLAYYVVAVTFIYSVSSVYFMLSCIARQEMEADHIGMLIAASAGYDPRMAPQMHLKLGKNSPSSGSHNVVCAFLNPYPNANTRAQLLSRPKVMEEALAIYAEALNYKGNK